MQILFKNVSEAFLPIREATKVMKLNSWSKFPFYCPVGSNHRRIAVRNWWAWSATTFRWMAHCDWLLLRGQRCAGIYSPHHYATTLEDCRLCVWLQARFFHSVIVQFGESVLCSPVFLFSGWQEQDVVLCIYRPSASRFTILTCFWHAKTVI